MLQDEKNSLFSDEGSIDELLRKLVLLVVLMLCVENFYNLLKQSLDECFISDVFEGKQIRKYFSNLFERSFNFSEINWFQ